MNNTLPKKRVNIYESFTSNKKIFNESSDIEDYNIEDEDAATEIDLFIENDGNLYRQQFIPIIKNIKRKIKSGKYDHKLAPKLWIYLIENGMKKYAKEFGGTWNDLLSKQDRMKLATMYADRYYEQIQDGEFDDF